MSAIGGNYKFKHLKVFGSVENLYQNVKKYRRVFDESECRNIFADLAIYNKLFDERDWSAEFTLICMDEAKKTKICELKKNYTVSKDQNLFHVREGWGTPNPGWWKKGQYSWEALVNGQSVGKVNFHVVNAGLVTETSNPYFKIKSVRLFESGNAATPMASRKYLKTFKKGSRYINIELSLDLLKCDEDSLPLEFQFNFYNDAGQHKGYMEYLINIEDKRATLTFDTGYGTDGGNYWFEDKYSLEMIFMDQLIGVVPFNVAEQEEEQVGSLPYSVGGRGVLTTLGGLGVETPGSLSFEEATAELNALIGLESVKKQIDELATYLRFIQLRKEKGFKEESKISLHTVFTGNPGTGKTTVARMLGLIYKSLGLLSKGEVHEVGRVDLVGEFIGQTAPKVQKAIDKARGGILFVDEAYALSDRGDDSKDFGKEVIEVLLKEMSDGKGDIAIFFAGYPKEMQTFLTKNPGMQSRIQKVISFPDYTPSELMEIAQFSAQKRDVRFEAEAEAYLHKKVVEAYRSRSETFGNARFVNGVVEECKQNMALRLMRKGENLQGIERDKLDTILLEDVEKAFGTSNRKHVHIPVDESLLAEALAELHEMIGLEEIKHDVDEMAKLVRYYTEIGRDVRKAFSLHTVFTGNPGTGKTTVARIIVKIYKALGVLERGHLIETDRKGLVAGYVGQTAIKTDEMIVAAKGGGLFIDEAYALTEGGANDFGREAIDTLLKRMEDQRGEFMVIVAGYPEEMKKFLESNPGLLSRFDRTLKFPDYSAAELERIAVDMLDKDDVRPDAEALELIREYIAKLLEHKHKYFGNARTIRKFVKDVVRRQNLRLANMPSAERSPEMVRLVTAEDLRELKLLEQDERNTGSGIGFKRD